MKVTIDIPDAYVPDALWEALGGLACSIRRLRQLKTPTKYQKEDLATQLEDFAALRRTWKYYSVPHDHYQVDDIALEDED